MTAHRPHLADATDDPRVMPQWMFNIVIRPSFGTIARMIWGMKLYGTQYIPQHGSVIIVANHQTYFDPFWISIPIKRATRYLAWNEAFDWKLTGRFMYLFGAYPLQLEGGDKRAMQRSLKWLKHGGETGAGGALMIFPEGGRGNPDGALHRFKTGAARLAIVAGAPILPVTIRGGHRVWNSQQKIPRKAEVSITYHPLYHIELRADEDERAAARRVTDDLMTIINPVL